MIRYGAVVFIAQNAVNLVNFVFHVAVSRRLGVVDYGELNALLAGFTILAVPSAILATVAAKYAAEFRALGDVARLRALVRRVTVALGAVALLLVPLGAFAAAPIAAYLHAGSNGAVTITLAILALNVLLPALRGVLQGVEDFVAYGISTGLEAGLKLVLAIVLTSLGWGVNGALAAWALASLAALAYTYGTLAWRYRRVPVASLSIDYAKLGRTSANVAFATIVFTAMGFGDVLIVKHYFDSETAGLYGAAALAGKMLFYLVGFAPLVVLPRAAHEAAQGRAATPVLFVALGLVALIAGAGLVAYALAPRAIVTTLAGSAFAAAAPLVFPYGIAATLLAALGTIVFFKVGIHRFDFVLPIAAIALAELVTIVLYHPTARGIILVLIAGDGLAIVASLVHLGPRAARAAR